MHAYKRMMIFRAKQGLNQAFTLNVLYFYRHTQIVTVYCIAQFPVGEPRRDRTLEEKD